MDEGESVFDTEQLDEKKGAKIDSSLATDEDIQGLLGTWVGEAEMAQGMVLPFSLEFTMDDDELGGGLTFAMGKADLSRVLFDGARLSFTSTFDRGVEVSQNDCEGQIGDDAMDGSCTTEAGEMTFTATKRGEQAREKED